MSCKFCDFKVKDYCDDELGDYLEGCIEQLGSIAICLSKLEHGSTTLAVSVEKDWDEPIPYTIGNLRGCATVPTGYEGREIFDVDFCPMCGREL